MLAGGSHNIRHLTMWLLQRRIRPFQPLSPQDVRFIILCLIASVCTLPKLPWTFNMQHVIPTSRLEDAYRICHRIEITPTNNNFQA